VVSKINKKILLAVTGGIAAYKSAELVRLLRKENTEVRVVMTRAAMQFVTPLTFQALSSHPVATELLDVSQENAMNHINLARWADLLIVAPASADIIAKFSYGIADDLLTTLYLASECPVYVAPAMNQAMWKKVVTQENLMRLQQHGVSIIGPEAGNQACGEQGYGRMTEPADICAQLITNKDSPLLRGKSVLISAGPTREPLDPVRYITNRSSGKMGYALADAAIAEGANVTLVSGPVSLTPHSEVNLVKVETAAQMYDEVLQRSGFHDVYIGAAAVADYSPDEIKPKKIKKHAEQTSLTLHKNKDILGAVANLNPHPFTVGFAAETDDLERYARGKLERKNLDMIAANWVGKDVGGFEDDKNALQVFWRKGQKAFELMDKKELAKKLIALIAERMNEKSTT
jgi:phosphopantothenoylcysteine decarboxylase/phosphopantothenate--cysteine ligase